MTNPILAPELVNCAAWMSLSVEFKSTVYETTKLPLASIATSASCSFTVLLATTVSPSEDPLLLNRLAMMSVWPLTVFS